MCQIEKIKTAKEVLAQIAIREELIERLSKEYNNGSNFKMAIELVEILLDEAAKALSEPDALYMELYRGICKIEFTKADGTASGPRIATLSVEHGAPSPENERKIDPKKAHLLTFYDLEKQGLRACKIASITKFKRVIGGK